MQNVNFQHGAHIHFVGVGGIGMSALAHLLKFNCYDVTGSDVVGTDCDFPVTTGHSLQFISPKLDYVVRSYAVPDDDPEVMKAHELGIPVLFYPEALSVFSRGYRLIAVAGSHGKSTTVSMLAQIMVENGYDPTVLVGTRVPFLGGKNYRCGVSRYLLIEACEYRDAFLNYMPEVALVTNVEPDHLDYFKTDSFYYDSFKRFGHNISDSLVIHRDSARFFEDNKKIVTVDDLVKMDLKVPGYHNLLNANLAVLAATVLGIPRDCATASVKNFLGSWRRLEYKGMCNGAPVYDDYGHHPTEIRTTLKALKELYPSKKIVTVFQPHQYARLLSLYDGFLTCFDSSDCVIVPNIYYVRDTEADVIQISAEKYAQDIQKASRRPNFAVYGDGFANTVMYLKQHLTNEDVCICMGAGDIFEMTPLLFK